MFHIPIEMINIMFERRSRRMKDGNFHMEKLSYLSFDSRSRHFVKCRRLFHFTQTALRCQLLLAHDHTYSIQDTYQIHGHHRILEEVIEELSK